MKKLWLALALSIACAGAVLAAVNINTATKEELTSIQGIGDKTAQAIIDYRKKHGEFKSIDDLEKVEGIGPATLKRIRGRISVSGATTIDKPVKAANKAGASAKSKGGSGKADKVKVGEKSPNGDKEKMALSSDKSQAAMGAKSATPKTAAGQFEKKMATK